MFNKNKNEKPVFGLIGLGRFGQALAMALIETNAELLVIDRDEEKVREMREYTENAFVIDHIDKKSLGETGIQNCDVAIICVSEMETSILTTLNLVSMGIPKVIAKANNMDHGEILEKLGAEIVFPERDMALRLACRLETSTMLDVIQLSEKINISKVNAPKFIIGKKVVDIDFRGKFGINIIAIENKGNVIDAIDPKYEFKAGDVLFLAGGKNGLYRMTEWIEKH